MKKILVLLVAASLGLAACSSKKNTKQDSSSAVLAKNSAAAKSQKTAKYQIIDQEFDNLLAPDKDYDTLSAYELQACGDSYLPDANLKPITKAGVKAAAKAKVNLNEREKEVTNIHNVYYVENGKEVLQSSKTTKTVYKDGFATTTTTTGATTTTTKKVN